MGERYWARLVLRECDVTPEVRAALEAGGPYDEGPDAEDGMVRVVGYERWWGEFSTLEEKLVALGVAFDRYSESNPPVERRFRPGRDGKPSVDVEIPQVDGEPFVLLSELRKLLQNCKDYISLHEGLSQLVEKREPVPPLDSD